MAREQYRILNIKEITFHVQATLDKAAIEMEKHVRDDLLRSESQHLKDSSVWKHLWVLINDSLMKALVNFVLH